MSLYIFFAKAARRPKMAAKTTMITNATAPTAMPMIAPSDSLEDDALEGLLVTSLIDWLPAAHWLPAQGTVGPATHQQSLSLPDSPTTFGFSTW